MPTAAPIEARIATGVKATPRMNQAMIVTHISPLWPTMRPSWTWYSAVRIEGLLTTAQATIPVSARPKAIQRYTEAMKAAVRVEPSGRAEDHASMREFLLKSPRRRDDN